MYLERLYPPGVVMWMVKLHVWVVTLVAVLRAFVSEWHVIIQLDLYPAVCYVRPGLLK